MFIQFPLLNKLRQHNKCVHPNQINLIKITHFRQDTDIDNSNFVLRIVHVCSYNCATKINKVFTIINNGQRTTEKLHWNLCR